MTVPELKALAKEKGIEGASSLGKEDLLAVLKEVM
ncbi:Rho termination factor N-terminal domain-containing protein [Lacrimispora xylanisolvens]